MNRFVSVKPKFNRSNRWDKWLYLDLYDHDFSDDLSWSPLLSIYRRFSREIITPLPLPKPSWSGMHLLALSDCSLRVGIDGHRLLFWSWALQYLQVPPKITVKASSVSMTANYPRQPSAQRCIKRASSQVEHFSFEFDTLVKSQVLSICKASSSSPLSSLWALL